MLHVNEITIINRADVWGLNELCVCRSQQVGGTQGAGAALEMRILIINIISAAEFCKLSQAMGWDGVWTNKDTYLKNVEQEWNAQSWAWRFLKETCLSL